MILVLWTAGSSSEARAVARTLLENRWAACVNLIPGVESLFIWEGRLEEVEEVKVLIKTTEEHYKNVSHHIHESSSYDIPEVIKIAADSVSDKYERWLCAALDPNS